MEGALHWFNTVPRLLLLVMPLCIGWLDVMPVRLTGQAVVGLLLPIWIGLLLSVGWLNRGSRHALLADLPGWALAVPLAATVLASLWGKVQPFRITPKHRVRNRSEIAPVLAAPLLVLLVLNGLNLLLILSHISKGATAGSWLGLLWGALTLLGLLVALRACQDPAAGDPTPWVKLSVNGTLWARDQAGHTLRNPVQIHALSECGAAINGLDGLPQGYLLEALQLHAPDDALPLLPVERELGEGQRLTWAWPNEACATKNSFMGWLYGRPGAWPERQAPSEWRAFGALLKRLISPGSRAPQRLSLVPQQLVPQQLVPQRVPDTCGSENHSDRSPAFAS
jgi:cellulose synthase (UDP-forming)